MVPTVHEPIVAKILDNRVWLGRKPIMEQRVGAVPGPSGFVGMPTEEFAFEHFSEHAAKYIVRFAVIVDLRDQLCGLLAVHIRHEARIIQPCCPIEKGLLRTHDKNSSIQHGKPSGQTLLATGQTSLTREVRGPAQTSLEDKKAVVRLRSQLHAVDQGRQN